MTHTHANDRQFKVIGHRGANGHAPENTLAGIEKGIELGADMIEVDTLLLPSGEIILLHDDRIDRTTSGEGIALNLSFDYLRSLDAGHGARIPTLQEAIELIDSRVTLNIELKRAGTAAPSAQAVADVLKGYLNKGWNTDRFIVTSFNHHELRDFKTALPEITTGALLYSVPLDYATLCEPLEAGIIAPATDMVTPELVTDAHSRGILVYSWVWQPVYREETEMLYKMGIDGLYTDFPDETRRVIADL